MLKNMLRTYETEMLKVFKKHSVSAQKLDVLIKNLSVLEFALKYWLSGKHARPLPRPV